MAGWTETWRGIVAPWECDITQHFTIAYYFDRLADATPMLASSLGINAASQSAGRRLDVRFVRELRAGASFHILSAPLALDKASLRLGHQYVDSANGEVTAWVEETLDNAVARLSDKARDAIERGLASWPGPVVERRPEPTTTQGFIPTARDRARAADFDADGNFTLAAFVHRFTTGCMQALAAIGATAVYLEADRKGFSTFELALRVTGWPQLGSPVLVETGIMHLGNSSIRFLHRMSDPVVGREFARMGQFGVQLDLDTRRPAALPEALKTAAQRLVVPVS